MPSRRLRQPSRKKNRPNGAKSQASTCTFRNTMCFVVVFAYAMVACLAILNFYNQGTKYALPNLYLNKDALLESNPSTIPLRIGSSDPNKPLFIFHVGPPKTGTTSIQCTLINNEKLLETDNFVFIGKASDCPASSRKGQRLFVEPKELSICVKSGVSECQEYYKLELILEGALERGQNVVFSAENAFIFGTHKVFKQLLMKRWNVKVVVTYRRYYEWLVSYYNSKYKPSLMRRDRADLNVWPAKGGKSIPTFDQILSGNFTKGNKVAQFNFNWYQDVITEFEKHYHDVVVLNMHDGRPGDDDVSESSILVKKFACDVMNAANTCKRGKVSALKNPSAKLYPDMLALAAYDENLFAWKKISRENVRKAILRYDGLGENVPLKCISKQHEDELLRASLRYEEEFLPKFYESPRGKVVHMRKFRDSTSTLFCNVDTEEALRDHHWTSFFNSLTDTNAVPWN